MKEHNVTQGSPDTLPALRIELTGMVTVSNLDEFKNVALTAIRGVNRDLITDQHFADAEQAVKWCEQVETRLKAAKEHALSQTASIDQLFKSIDDISAEARKVRLDLDKLVKARKEELRGQIVRKSRDAYDAHILALNQRIGGKALMASAYRNIPEPDFAGVIKGKRSLAGIQDAVDAELARAKIEANEVADRITVNLRAIEAVNIPLLFADLAELVHKAQDDLAAVIESRVAKFKADEAAREAAKAAIAQAQAPAAVATQPAAAVTQPAPAVQCSPLMKLGEINARIAPLSISVAGLAELGFEPAKTEGASKLYRASDLCRMCHAMAQHLMSAAPASRVLADMGGEA